MTAPRAAHGYRDELRPDIVLRQYQWARPELPYWQHPARPGERFTTADAWALTASWIADEANATALREAQS